MNDCNVSLPPSIITDWIPFSCKNDTSSFIKCLNFKQINSIFESKLANDFLLVIIKVLASLL